MRSIWCVAMLLTAAACGAGDDSWVVRPPGGGGGGVGGRVDAAPPDADRGDAGAGLTGQVCVVSEFRTPDACPDVAAARGVTVRRLGDATGAISDGAGGFTLDLTDAVVVLEVGAGAPTLIPALVPVRNDGTRVAAPVATEAAWLELVAATGTVHASGTGAVVVYIDDADGTRAEAAELDPPAAAATGAFYDRASGAWVPAGGTGPAGVAVLVELPPGSYTLTGRDVTDRPFTLAGVPVAADAITFTRVRLAP
ncbi:MAG: hypothetical protein R3B06_33010 [Kofleriaceae bacterium]